MTDNRVTGAATGSIAADRRWQQVLAFGCLPDGSAAAEQPAVAAPGALFEVLP